MSMFITRVSAATVNSPVEVTLSVESLAWNGTHSSPLGPPEGSYTSRFLGDAQRVGDTAENVGGAECESSLGTRLSRCCSHIITLNKK